MLQLGGWALILAAFFVIDDGGIALGVGSAGGVIAAITGVILAREAWSELLLATGGILLARDYGGSVDWMMTIFWKRQAGRLPRVEGRWARFQMRGIGVVAAIIGLAWAAGGVYVFIDRIV
jgi:hypothetical protein